MLIRGLARCSPPIRAGKTSEVTEQREDKHSPEFIPFLEIADSFRFTIPATTFMPNRIPLFQLRRHYNYSSAPGLRQQQTGEVMAITCVGICTSYSLNIRILQKT